MFGIEGFRGVEGGGSGEEDRGDKVDEGGEERRHVEIIVITKQIETQMMQVDGGGAAVCCERETVDSKAPRRKFSFHPPEMRFSGFNQILHKHNPDLLHFTNSVDPRKQN